jgi:hypothetical protein
MQKTVLDSALEVPDYGEFFDLPLANKQFELKPSNSCRILSQLQERDMRIHFWQMLQK